MELERIKEINEKVLQRAVEKVEKAMEVGTYDAECYHTMSIAIDNIKDLSKIEKYHEELEQLERMEEIQEFEALAEEKPQKNIRALMAEKVDAKEETTEFEALIYEIAEKKDDIESMLAITTVLAETMEDLRLLHPKIYNMTMLKLKECLNDGY